MQKINFDEFIHKTLGKRIDTDSYPPEQPYQCVDLAKYYNILYFKPFQVYCSKTKYAKDWATEKHTNGILEYYDETHVNNMIKGTLVVWGNCKVAPKSHIGFFIEDNRDGTFKCLQQNAPYPYVTISNISYVGIIGAFIPKNIERNSYQEKSLYITNGEMYLRKQPSLNSTHVFVREMTEDGKRNATSTNPSAWAVYKKGTRFNVYEKKKSSEGTLWGRTPSGWIVLVGASGTHYCDEL